MATKKQPLSVPATLMQAHDQLTRMRPSLTASAQTWLKYYRHSAAVYAEVAEIDRGHHHEAMYWANRERAKANKLWEEVSSVPERPVIERVKEQDAKPSDATVHTEQ